MFSTLLMRRCFFAKLLNAILALSNGCESWRSCSWCPYEAMEYLTYSLGICSILSWILSIWVALGCIFCILARFMHCQQGGEVWACFGLLNASRWSSGGFEPFLGSVVHRSDWLRSPVWPVRVLVLFTCWAPVWPVVSTGLTGQSWAVAAALFREVVHMHSYRGSCIASGGACMCAGGALCGFWALVCWFVLFAWACLVLDVSSRCPCLRGPRLVFFKWSCSLPFLWFSISCWRFF
jgi:hypothetical protein